MATSVGVSALWRLDDSGGGQRTDYMYCREAQMLGSEGSQTAPARPFGTGRLENGIAWESEERRRQVHCS